MKTIELAVEKRSTTGKNEARRSREGGRIPAVVYGAGKPTVPISVDRKALADVFRAGAGENAIFLLKLGADQSRHAMIREFQRHPVSRKPVHIDFVRVLMDVKVTVKVPIEVVGVAIGVKADAGILDLVTREIEIECLPANIPAHIARGRHRSPDRRRDSHLGPGGHGRRHGRRQPGEGRRPRHAPDARGGARGRDRRGRRRRAGRARGPQEGQGRHRGRGRRTRETRRRRRKRRSSLCTRSSASGIRGTTTKRPATTRGFGSSRRWRQRRESGSALASVPRGSAGAGWGRRRSSSPFRRRT